MLKKCLILLFIAIASPQSVLSAKETTIPYDIEVKQFNSIASQYMSAPTFVAIKTEKKYDQLILNVDLIKRSRIRAQTGAPYERLAFSMKKKRFDKVIEAIDKYLKWNELATQDGDVFTKRISYVKYNSSSYNEFRFHSGALGDHYLVIEKYSFSLADSLATPGEPKIYENPKFVFDKDNVIKLKNLLLEWEAGEFDGKTTVDLDDKYK